MTTMRYCEYTKTKGVFVIKREFLIVAIYVPFLLTFISGMLSLVFLIVMSGSDFLSEKVSAEVKDEYENKDPIETIAQDIVLDCDDDCTLEIPIDDDDSDHLTVTVDRQGGDALYKGVAINNGDTITYRTEASFDAAFGWLTISSEKYPDVIDSVNGVRINHEN